MKVVITYKNADLDCVASAYAYSELLNKKNDQANYYISGVVQKEVDIVCSLFNINLSNNIENIDDKSIIVVDTNTYSSIDFVNPDHIIEIIDHHPRSNDEYRNAIINIEKVGAVCTLIAEKYRKENIDISREAAILLYYGIISNTVNFKSKVTTPRDLEICEWLKGKCPDINDNLIRTIFEEKSKFDIKDLRTVMEIDEKFSLGADELIIGQLELVDAKEFLEKNKELIDRVVEDVQKEHKVPLIFINIIDILKGYHILYTPLSNTRDYLHNNFQITFDGDTSFEDEVVLRKEVKQYLRSVLESKKINL